MEDIDTSLVKSELDLLIKQMALETEESQQRSDSSSEKRGEEQALSQNETFSCHELDSKMQQRKNEAPQWTEQEDEALKELMKNKSSMKWKDMSEAIAKITNMQKRQPDAISQRWSRVINPEINKGRWSKEEEKLLFDEYKKNPNMEWKELAAKMTGRTDIQVRYRITKAIQSGLLK